MLWNKEERTETAWKIMSMKAAIHPTRQGETIGTANMPVVQKGRYYIQQEMNRKIMAKKLLFE